MELIDLIRQATEIAKIRIADEANQKRQQEVNERIEWEAKRKEYLLEEKLPEYLKRIADEANKGQNFLMIKTSYFPQTDDEYRDSDFDYSFIFNELKQLGFSVQKRVETYRGNGEAEPMGLYYEFYLNVKW